jgi:hypothetical protein
VGSLPGRLLRPAGKEISCRPAGVQEVENIKALKDSGRLHLGDLFGSTDSFRGSLPRGVLARDLFT